MPGAFIAHLVVFFVHIGGLRGDRQPVAVQDYSIWDCDPGLDEGWPDQSQKNWCCERNKTFCSKAPKENKSHTEFDDEVFVGGGMSEGKNSSIGPVHDLSSTFSVDNTVVVLANFMLSRTAVLRQGQKGKIRAITKDGCLIYFEVKPCKNSVEAGAADDMACGITGAVLVGWEYFDFLHNLKAGELFDDLDERGLDIEDAILSMDFTMDRVGAVDQYCEDEKALLLTSMERSITVLKDMEGVVAESRKLRSDFRHKKAQVTKLKEEGAKMKTACDKRKEKLQALKKTAEEERKQLEELKIANEELKKKVDELTATNEALRKENKKHEEAEVQKAKGSCEEKLQALRKENKEHEKAEVQKAKGSCEEKLQAELQKARETFNKTFKELIAENEALRKDVNKAGILANITGKIASEKELYEKTKKKREAEEASLHDRTKKYEESELKLRKLEKKLNKTEHDIDQARKQRAEDETQRAEAEKQLLTSLQKREDERKKLRANEDWEEVAHAEELELEASRKAIANMTEANDGFSKLLKQCMDTIHSCKNRSATFESKHAKAKQEVASVTKQLLEIKERLSKAQKECGDEARTAATDCDQKVRAAAERAKTEANKKVRIAEDETSRIKNQLDSAVVAHQKYVGDLNAFLTTCTTQKAEQWEKCETNMKDMEKRHKEDTELKDARIRESAKTLAQQEAELTRSVTYKTEEIKKLQHEMEECEARSKTPAERRG